MIGATCHTGTVICSCAPSPHHSLGFGIQLQPPQKQVLLPLFPEKKTLEKADNHGALHTLSSKKTPYSMWFPPTLSRVPHGFVVEPDHRETAAEGHHVRFKLCDFGVFASSISKGLTVGLDLDGIRFHLLGDRDPPVEESCHLFEILLCEESAVWEGGGEGGRTNERRKRYKREEDKKRHGYIYIFIIMVLLLSRREQSNGTIKWRVKTKKRMSTRTSYFLFVAPLSHTRAQKKCEMLQPLQQLRLTRETLHAGKLCRQKKKLNKTEAIRRTSPLFAATSRSRSQNRSRFSTSPK